CLALARRVPAMESHAPVPRGPDWRPAPTPFRGTSMKLMGIDRHWIALCTPLLMAIAAAGCSDDSPADGDTMDDTSTPDITVDQTDMDPGDVADEDMMVQCSQGDNRCIGDDRRAVCQPDGQVKLESCTGDDLCWDGVCGPVV